MNDLTTRQLVEAIRLGKFSAKDCLAHFHQVFLNQETDVRAFSCGRYDDAMASLKVSASAGPLNGIPVAVKDAICTQDMNTTACSSMLNEFRPPYDATVVSRLRDAGAVIVGKTNMDEFAMGSSTENSCFGATRNPWDHSRVAGGSSGGSAAAVAAGMAPIAIGTDTGGSIRQPAAFCGISGLKPTYGLVSRLGLIAFASSLDQIGPMGRSAEDVALLLSVIAGHDPGDSTSSSRPPPNFMSSLNKGLSGLRIGICGYESGENVDPGVGECVRQALQVFVDLGAELVEIDLPHEKYAVAAYYVVAPCEASSNLARYDGVRYTTRAAAQSLGQVYTQTRSQYFGPEVKRRILLGTYALSSGYFDRYYVKASRVRRLIKQDFDQAFERVHLIAGPTTPTTAFRLGERIEDPIQMYLADVFTVGANLAGIPAMSIPCGFVNRLPVGLQLQGPAFDEPRLLNAAHQFQQATDWHLRRPS